MDTDALLKKAMQQIAAASAGFHMSEISRLHKLAERIAEIQQIQGKLAQELHLLAVQLDRPTTTPNSAAQAKPAMSEATVHQSISPPAVSSDHPRLLGPLAIEIDWAAAGLPHPKQTICERKASDTLRVLFETVLDRFGDAAMEKLSVLRVNRAPPLSRRPEIDFLNRKRGVPYQHQRVGRSDWHVLTHSATYEKIDLIHQVGQALRFPDGAIAVREIDVQDEIRRFLDV
jgi:hypothetical protein